MLHTVNKSPFEKNSLESCLRLAKDGSDVLLIEDGVVGAIKGTKVEEMLTQAMAKVSIHVLKPDLEARGFSEEKLIPGINAVNYQGFVELSVKNENFQAWL